MSTFTRGGRRGRKSKLASASYTELKNEMLRRQEQVQSLVQMRERLSAELLELETLIETIGGGDVTTTTIMPTRRRGPGRPPGSGRAKTTLRTATPRHGRTGGRRGNTSSLVESLQAVLAGRTMGVSEVATVVQKSGYKTTSPNFRTIVNQALLANKGKFKKVARGQYTAK